MDAPNDDAELMAELAPHFVPEMDEAGKKVALNYLREIKGKSYEEMAVTMACLHMITESVTKMLDAKEKGAALVTEAAKGIWAPTLNGFRKRYN